MQQILTKIKELDAELVAISPELPDHSLSWAEKKALTFQVLSDQGNLFARQCGLVFTLPEELRPIYTDWGINLPETNGDNTFELPLPATYVVDIQSRITLCYVDADYTKRLEPVEILNALKTLSS